MQAVEMKAASLNNLWLERGEAYIVLLKNCDSQFSLCHKRVAKAKDCKTGCAMHCVYTLFWGRDRAFPSKPDTL